jgi:streptomycin 6-kinase
MDSYVNTMKKLHDKRIPENHNYSHISHWLKALDNLTSDQVPVSLLNKVIHLKDSLLESIGPPVLLHGDLHHDNILQNNNEWLAIDPKGIIGEPEFEIAAFDFMSVEELSNHSDVKNIFNQRIALLSYKSNLNTQRIKDWVIVRLLLMVAWSVEDNADPTAAIKLAKRLFRL